MVRVFKCHRFASQRVIPLSKEPLTICADGDKVFVATSDCEIIVFQIKDGSFKEIHRCPTISQVDLIVYNSFKSYIVTVELKKSWKRETKSVHVYLNWQINIKNGGKPRTKVSVAGKSHVQHASSPFTTEVMEIIEVPMDKNATCAAVCKYTGNFAIACNTEVKLCSVVEKTVANSDKTYLDVEIFLELCWNFPVKSIAMCEEFIVCCSYKEVQGIRVRYDEGEKSSVRAHRKFLTSPTTSIGSGGKSISASTVEHDSSRRSSGAATPQSYVSETYLFNDQRRAERIVSFSPQSDLENSGVGCLLTNQSDSRTLGKDFSTVGMRPGGRLSPKAVGQSLVESTDSKIIDDEDFVEWNFQPGGGAAGSAAVCLPGLHTSISQSQCHHHAQTISPPVLSDFLGGKVKSSSGVQAETVLHLCDSREKEDWMSVVLVPTFHGGLSTPLRVSSINTDRMRSTVNTNRTSMCCYISGNRGGYLYQISPLLTQISSYKYTDLAFQVGLSQSHLHVVTTTGIETYTSRWGIVSIEMGDKEDDQDCSEQIYPSSTLDICLCGHEPFFSAVNLSVGGDFLALLSKVQDPKGKEEAHWGLYILNMLSLLDTYREMISFAQGIHTTGPASYIHLLQEAHLLLSTHPLYTATKDEDVKQCLREVSRMLGDFYAQPGQEDWCLCSPFYKSSRVTVEDVVTEAVGQAEKQGVREFGKGLIDYLDGILFSQEEFVSLNSSTCDTILNIYAVASPDKLSKVILLSNMRAYSTEAAYHHLKTWLSVKASASQPISATDKLAMVQLHLSSCEVDHACSLLTSIHKPSLVDICSSHPSLIRENLSTFTSLAQMMRQHMSHTLLEILVEMLDRCVMSLDSLLILLNSQSDHPYNNHTREVLELILTDSRRIFLFEEAVHLLCNVYLARLKNKDQPAPRQVTAASHQKFFLPQGDGHFSPRFAWLDYLPPFYDPEKIAKPCLRLEIKHIPGQTLRTNSMPIAMTTKQVTNERCHCCACNESLLKLQSLLCSSRLTTDLAAFVLNQLGSPGDDDQELSTDSDDDKYLDGVRLLCLTKLDLEKATEQIVDCYPSTASSFAVCCFKGSIEKFTYVLRYMETTLKKFQQTPGDPKEESYVKSYKDLLSRLTEIFPPAQFLDLLPTDGNLFFLLPFLCSSLKLAHTSKLKRKITDMGRELMRQT
ncbi:unnamed protein product [Lymnaea stagnalis]|uniref:Uncharacterized protein n=1 Tax=Lymnaea stagnalis TaxID=6523 RepID=A0AAV2IKF3_LYMST